MLKNKFILGILVGLLADGVKLTVNFLLFKLNLTSLVFWQLISLMLVEVKDVHMPLAIFIGAAADITVTSLLGILFIYFVYFTGKDYVWLKGIGFAMLTWVTLFGVLLAQLVNSDHSHNPTDIIVIILAHFSFGVAISFFTKILGKNIATFREDLIKFIKATKDSKKTPQLVKSLSKR